MNILSNPNRIAENYGLRIAAGLIAFFFLMKVIGLGHNAELRLFNLVILTVGIWAALRKFRDSILESATLCAFLLPMERARKSR